MWKRYEDLWWNWDRFQALLNSLSGTKIGTLIFLMIKYLPYRSYYISIWIKHPTASRYAPVSPISFSMKNKLTSTTWTKKFCYLFVNETTIIKRDNICLWNGTELIFFLWIIRREICLDMTWLVETMCLYQSANK